MMSRGPRSVKDALGDESAHRYESRSARVARLEARIARLFLDPVVGHRILTVTVATYGQACDGGPTTRVRLNLDGPGTRAAHALKGTAFACFPVVASDLNLGAVDVWRAIKSFAASAPYPTSTPYPTVPAAPDMQARANLAQANCLPTSPDRASATPAGVSGGEVGGAANPQPPQNSGELRN